MTQPPNNRSRPSDPLMKRFSLLLLLTVALGSGLCAQIAPRIERTTVAGVDVLVLPTGVQNVVTIRGSLPAGDAAARENPALATLTGGLVDQGTTRRDKFALAELLDAVGATISFSVDNDLLHIAAKCLTGDVPMVLELIAEQLRSPAFDPAEFVKLKTQLTGRYRRALESTEFRADQAFNHAVYPPSHPNHQPAVETFLQAIEAAPLEAVQAFHTQHYGPRGLRLVLVGDVDPATAASALAAGFAGWSGGSELVRAAQPAPRPAAPSPPVTVAMPDKTSIDLVLGQPTGLRHRDPDALPLRVGTAILGSGFTGRLLANVRDREGLTYSIYAATARDSFNDGEWFIKASFAPDLLAQGLASTRRQLAEWYEHGVSAEELRDRKTNLAGTYKLQMADTEGLAATILANVNRGYPLEHIDDYPRRIAALTLEEVNQAIRRHLQPERMVLTQAGTLPAD
jgi:zinc protease